MQTKPCGALALCAQRSPWEAVTSGRLSCVHVSRGGSRKSFYYCHDYCWPSLCAGGRPGCCGASTLITSALLSHRAVSWPNMALVNPVVFLDVSIGGGAPCAEHFGRDSRPLQAFKFPCHAGSHSGLANPQPRVYYSAYVSFGRARLEFELYADSCPKTAENFRALCTGEKGVGRCGKTLRETAIQPPPQPQTARAELCACSVTSS